MADFPLAKIGLTAVINKDVALVDGARAAGDYDNDTDKANFCDALLRVQWNTTPPAVGDEIAQLWLLFGDGEVSESFPEGGDGTVGNSVDPQAALLVGSFETRAPSISADEELQVKDIPLRVGATNRFVLKNVSGEEFDLTWQLDIVTYKWTTV